MTLYTTLDVSKDAPPDAVRKAYRKAARRAHPDHGGSPEAFQQLVLARDVLTDEARRAKYDATGTIDPGEADRAEANAMNLVAEAVNHVWTVCEQRRLDISAVDVVKDARTYLQGKVGECEANHGKAVDGARKIREFATRFKAKKDQPNRIRLMLEGRAAEIERNAETIVPMIAAGKRALEIMKDHSYDWEESNRTTFDVATQTASTFFTFR